MEPRKLDFVTFTERKLKLNDLDALYPAIVDLGLPERTRFQLAFGSVLWDHAGVSARVAHKSTRGGFWGHCIDAVNLPTRGGARARFRGEKATGSIVEMSNLYPDLRRLFDAIHGKHYFYAEDLIKRLPQMGSWAAFKLCDMAERTCGIEVDFTDVELGHISLHAYEGAKAAAQHEGLPVEGLLNSLRSRRWPMLAPPHRDRPLNIQEFETLFCNYSSKRWHDPGFETEVLHKELSGWGPLAERLLDQINRNKP